VVKFEQVGCASLVETTGLISLSDSTISWSEPKIFSLDGTPLCNAHAACESAKADEDSILFHSNFNKSVVTNDHGRCFQNSYAVRKAPSGYLEAQFAVSSCSDGYAGKSLKVFSQY
jgi:hypothetical protein